MSVQPWYGTECNFLSQPFNHIYYYNNTANAAMNFHNANSVIYDYSICFLCCWVVDDLLNVIGACLRVFDCVQCAHLLM